MTRTNGRLASVVDEVRAVVNAVAAGYLPLALAKRWEAVGS